MPLIAFSVGLNILTKVFCSRRRTVRFGLVQFAPSRRTPQAHPERAFHGLAEVPR